MSARITVRMPLAGLPEGELAHDPRMRADWERTAHRGESGAEPCTWRNHDEPHPATVQLTPDPDPGVRFPHTQELTVCSCCAFERGHLYEEMRGECRTNGHVDVKLRQEDGSWV